MGGETAYVFGAGLNRAVRDWDRVSPPLAHDFFQILLTLGKFSHEGSPLQERLSIVFDYINRYWRLTPERLKTVPFDLEKCFTLIDLQFREELQQGRQDDANHLRDVAFRLKSALAETFSEFDHHFSPTMYDFGRVLWSQRPTMITFNYDTYLEQALESGSGVDVGGHPATFNPMGTPHEFTPEELVYSHYNWNRPLGYGFRFDVVKLHQAGVSQYVDGDRFYAPSENTPYDWPLMKLHGSINWFRYLPFRKYPALEAVEPLPPTKLGHALLVDGHWWFGEPPDFQGWYIDPLIITPVLYKEQYFVEPLFRRVLQPLWNRARAALEVATELVVIGYSFPGTDFHVEKMFREAFADHDLERVVIVNPDRDVDPKVRALTHYGGGFTTFDDLPSYVRALGATTVP
jgi:hypothetical protein